MGLYSGGLIIGRIFASEIWGAYFREGLFLLGGLLSEFYGIICYFSFKNSLYIFLLEFLELLFVRNVLNIDLTRILTPRY